MPETSQPSDTVTIVELGQAIAWWMEQEATVDYVICKPASKLADVLGKMIATRSTEVRVEEFKPATLEFFRRAHLAVNGAAPAVPQCGVPCGVRLLA